MIEIIEPTIDLFLYDLIENLGAAPEDIEKNQQYFQKKLPEDIQHKLLKPDNDFAVEYVHLLQSSYATFASESTYKGYYYPVRLGDTYGLLIECALDSKNEPQLTQSFKDLKQELEQNILEKKKGTIGQTWIISGCLPSSSSSSTEEIAKHCYQALMPDLNWEEELDGKGEYLGATVFELSRTRLVKQKLEILGEPEEIILNNQHTLVIIYPDRETLESLSSRFYVDWMRLFHYHHKILLTYAQSRFLQKNLKNYFSQIKSFETNKNRPKIQLTKLAQILQEIQYTLNDYATDLNNLEFQEGTIDINLSNYHQRISAIKKKSQELSSQGTNLDFFSEFAELVQDKYLLQIRKDKENLERGLRLLEDTIHATRSRVEVEKAERDRIFQNLVTFVGAGIGGASLIQASDKKCTVIPFFNSHSFPCDIPLLNSYIVPILLVIVFGLSAVLIKKFILRGH